MASGAAQKIGRKEGRKTLYVNGQGKKFRDKMLHISPESGSFVILKKINKHAVQGRLNACRPNNKEPVSWSLSAYSLQTNSPLNTQSLWDKSNPQPLLNSL